MGEARRKAEQLEKVGIRLPDGFTSLLISTPSYSGFSNVYVHAITPTVSMLTQLGIPKAILTLPGEAEVYRARNNLMAYFMASEHSHMLCIDADVHWKPEDVLRLLISGHEVVMGTYPRKKLPEPGQPMSYPIHWKLPSEDGKFETCPTCGSVAIEGGPAGFVMIRRSVGEKMAAAYPDLKYDGEGSVAEVSDHLYGFYNPMIEGRTMWSEDLSFCRRWRAIGGEIWLDPAIELDHQGTYIFKGSVKELIIQVPREAAQSGGRMILERIVEPKAEPITSLQAAVWCSAALASADGTVQADDQDLLDELVGAAREYLEDWTNPHIILAESSWRITFDRGEMADELHLPIGPIVSVDSVKFYDVEDIETAITTVTYRAVVGEFAGILLNYGQNWPDSPRSRGALVVEVTAGFQSSTGELTQTSTDTAVVVTGSALGSAIGRRVQYIVAAATKAVTFQVYADNDPTFATEASAYGPETVAAGATSTWTLPSAAKDDYRVKIASATSGQAGVATITGRRGLPPAMLLIGLRELVKFWHVHRGDGLFAGAGGWRGTAPDGQVQQILERLRSYRSPVVA